MIEKTLYDSLKHNNRSSFAIWASKNKNAIKDVSDLSVFDDFNRIATKIKPNIIFVAMNLAEDADNKMPPFSNFHSKIVAHNDYRLRDSIMGTFFEGAYMTDLFKLVTSSSSDLAKYYTQHPMERLQALNEFIEECRNIFTGKKYIISIGTGFHYKTICKYLVDYPDFKCCFNSPDDITKPCYYIPHYSGAAGNTDISYLNKTTLLLSKIEKDIISEAL